MFVIDDVLLSPVKGFMWIVRELHKAAQQDIAGQRDDAMRRLQSLHMLLEAGQIDEAEFDRRETELLDLLDTLDNAREDDEDEVDDEDADSADATNESDRPTNDQETPA